MWPSYLSTLLTFYIWQLHVGYLILPFIPSSPLHIFSLLFGLLKLTQGQFNLAFWPWASESYTAKVNGASASTSIHGVCVCVCGNIYEVILDLVVGGQIEVKSQMLFVCVGRNMSERDRQTETESVDVWVRVHVCVQHTLLLFTAHLVGT